jgi:hypothetical protein
MPVPTPKMKTTPYVANVTTVHYKINEIYDIGETTFLEGASLVRIYKNGTIVGNFLDTVLTNGYFTPLSIFRNNQINSILTDE